MKKRGLMFGAVILSVGGVLAKVFSAIYRIVLTRILGGGGIGLYQLIFPLYSLCVVVATSGLPMAISKVISKNNGNERKTLKKCFIFTSLVALSLTFFLLIFAKGIANVQGQPQLKICYMILAPTIIFLSGSSVIRGYFQGKHDFVPSAVSNILEQFIKLVVGLILCISLISVSIFAAIVGAVIAIVVSEIVSLVVLLLYIKKEKFKNGKSKDVKLLEIIKDILPITLTNIILPLSSFIDSILVVNLLSNNFSNQISVFLYGLESGAVSSLISLPTIFSFAIASVLLPNLTNYKHSFNHNHKLSLAVRVILVITIPCVISFILIPDRLISCIYSTRLNSFGMNGVAIASRLLSVSSIGVLFLALNQVFSSSLQAIDERFVTIRNLTISIVIRLIIEIVFLPSKILNIYSLAIANTVCYIVVMILNYLEIRENFKLNIGFQFAGKLALSNCCMILSLIFILSLKNNMIVTILAVIISIIVYFVSLYKTKIFQKKDIAMFKYKV